MKGYADFFREVTGKEPYPYQNCMGTEDWPDVLDVPTGMGKTAAIIVAWLWKQLNGQPDAPRRLVYCLPMRVLVEQTAASAAQWIERAQPFFVGVGRPVPTTQLLMGGDTDDEWRRNPEKPALLVGTQDMLLSRALMRGYGMTRYGWPVDFALLHNDCLWVYDEVQLMGPAVATSAQLEAFRRRWRSGKPTGSLWASATLRPDWLATVDFASSTPELAVRTLSDDDDAVAGERLRAKKHVSRSSVRLESLNATTLRGYAESLAAEIVSQHRSGTQTLVILNRVDRAQVLYRAIQRLDPDVALLLLHARFRAAERKGIERSIRETCLPQSGRIIVSTQAVEAGVDITSATLVTELAPWSSMVQRFGRCNRYGEVQDGANVVWIDMAVTGGDAAPYTESELNAAREILNGPITDVGPNSLPQIIDARPFGPVIRERDFLGLFNTDPDLQGFDIDIAPFVRDQGSPQVQVFWRPSAAETHEEAPRPARDELCPVSMGQLSAFLKKKVQGSTRKVWRWDPLSPHKGSGGGRWILLGTNDRVNPGSVLMLDCDDGGYDPHLGFDPSSTKAVSAVEWSGDGPEEPYGGDPGSHSSIWLTLGKHLDDVVRATEEIAENLSLEHAGRAALIRAAAWHDVGKAHAAFQSAIGQDAPREGEFWAKSPSRGMPAYGIPQEDGTLHRRPYFRHELASMLMWLMHNPTAPDRDLIAYLIAAHHGKVRTGLRALPGEKEPSDGRPFARGVWHGDPLPALAVEGTRVPETVLALDLMRMGWGPMGASWTERTGVLLRDMGPFELSWLEALLRIADWRGSVKGEIE